MDVQVWKCSQCFQVGILSPLFLRIVGLIQNLSSKISDRHQTLVGDQQVLSQTTKVKPVVPPPALGSEAVVEIESINVHRDSLYQWPLLPDKKRSKNIDLLYSVEYYYSTTSTSSIVGPTPRKGRFFFGYQFPLPAFHPQILFQYPISRVILPDTTFIITYLVGNDKTILGYGEADE